MADVIFGVDVSSYQGVVNWAQVRAAGNAFCIIKASEGGRTDPDRVAYLKRNVTSAHEAGMLVSCYHYYRPNDDPYLQAEVFFDAICQCQYEFDFCTALDVEEEVGAGMSVEQMTEGINIWIGRTYDNTGRIPMLYSNPWFLDAQVDLSALPYGMGRWVADWDSLSLSQPQVPPWEIALPDGWSYTNLWQYSQWGNVAGIDGDVDLDLFWGNASDLVLLGVS